MKIFCNSFLCFLFLIFFSNHSFAQKDLYLFEPSPEHPFGLPNPDGPTEILDWAPLIGECSCKSITRNPDQSWADTVDMIWRFKYILNGMGVQDETLKSDGLYAGSIRQFIPDSSKWYVHYYSSSAPSPILPSWGGKVNENGDIVLYREQTAPNGMEGFYKIEFKDITNEGFNWLGQWVNSDETIQYPTWKIFCSKEIYNNHDQDKKEILENISAFSKSYMNADYRGMAEAYTKDGKIFPGGSDIIEGHDAIEKRWEIKDGSKILHHKISPVEITFIGDHAYDYSYFEGSTLKPDGSKVDWKGKSVIVWRKEDGKWKIYLDIWNRL